MIKPVPFFSIFSVKALSAFCVMLLLVFSGCWNRPKVADNIQEPPYIPEPPAMADGAFESGNAAVKSLTPIRTYADLKSPSPDGGHRHPRLRAAVSHAVRLGVLKPARHDEAFEPERAITYEEFRTWVLAYQSALTDGGMIQTEGADVDASKVGGSAILPIATVAKVKPLESKDEKPVQRSAANPMDPNRMVALPLEMAWQEHKLTGNQPLTREVLCALAVFLSGRDDAAKALDAGAVKAMTPDGESLSQDEAFGQFKDFAAVSPWAQKYVAVAYRDGWIHRVFRLTPNRLTLESGLQPKTQATREDAIVLLDGLYGDRKPPEPVPVALPGATRQKQTGAAAQEIDPLATLGRDWPQPAGKVQKSRVVTPSGSRTAIRVSGPE